MLWAIGVVDPRWLSYVVGVGFIGIGNWTLLAA